MSKCPCCGGAHDYPRIDCNGKPIDWAARKDRACAYLKWRKVEPRLMTDIYDKTLLRWHEVTAYPHEEAMK